MKKCPECGDELEKVTEDVYRCPECDYASKCPDCRGELYAIEDGVYGCDCGYMTDPYFDPTPDYDINEEDQDERYEKLQRDAEKALERFG
ncbi:DNA-directed RNA polymerase subunit M/transcription elongation factor TFIIS [Paenibacillus sp. 1182]|uniref:hypothetical protein n=1 Tax=Paenibacillus sp. 1182 TaxID=2806565 RepID=UPI001AE41DD8|nr:hypothetical protein [Paenibacillus sp. 1182]MBP1309066.1 DNA-directed RNA polymerase subunit M/transcription elongation factor TFIIS [Paenibacillus sp. 1182]